MTAPAQVQIWIVMLIKYQRQKAHITLPVLLSCKKVLFSYIHLNSDLVFDLQELNFKSSVFHFLVLCTFELFEFLLFIAVLEWTISIYELQKDLLELGMNPFCIAKILEQGVESELNVYLYALS